MASQIIKSHIKSLNENSPHISDIVKKDTFCYKLTYSPTQTTSVYRDKMFRLQLTLSDSYPENPPSLRFLDSIYHLNVDKSNGNINMPILIEEWSPFLTITSLIESLDCLMEEPETKYPASPEMLDIYETDKDEYFKKVLNSFENSEIDIQEDLDISNRMAESFQDLQSPIQQIHSMREEIYEKKQQIKPERIKENKKIEFNYQLSEEDKMKNKKMSYGMQEYENMKNTFEKITGLINMEMKNIIELSRQIKSDDIQFTEIKGKLIERRERKLQDLKALQQFEQELRVKMMNSIQKQVRSFV